MRRFFRRAGPGLIAAGIPQIKFFAAVAIASGVPGAASYLWYADRLYELPLGIVSAIAAGVLVPVLAAHARAADGAALIGAQSRAIEFAAGLALPAAVGLVLLADPIARTLFERGAFGAADSAATAAVLAAMAFGLPGHVLEKVFAAGAYAHNDTATPMMTALAGLGVAIAGGVLLLPAFGAAGVAAAMAASGWVNAASLAAIEARRGRLRLDPATPATLAKVVAAAALMALALALGGSWPRAFWRAAPRRGCWRSRSHRLRRRGLCRGRPGDGRLRPRAARRPSRRADLSSPVGRSSYGRPFRPSRVLSQGCRRRAIH